MFSSQKSKEVLLLLVSTYLTVVHGNEALPSPNINPTYVFENVNLGYAQPSKPLIDRGYSYQYENANNFELTKVKLDYKNDKENSNLAGDLYNAFTSLIEDPHNVKKTTSAVKSIPEKSIKGPFVPLQQTVEQDYSNTSIHLAAKRGDNFFVSPEAYSNSHFKVVPTDHQNIVPAHNSNNSGEVQNVNQDSSKNDHGDKDSDVRTGLPSLPELGPVPEVLNNAEPALEKAPLNEEPSKERPTAPSLEETKNFVKNLKYENFAVMTSKAINIIRKIASVKDEVVDYYLSLNISAKKEILLKALSNATNTDLTEIWDNFKRKDLNITLAVQTFGVITYLGLVWLQKRTKSKQLLAKTKSKPVKSNVQIQDSFETDGSTVVSSKPIQLIDNENNNGNVNTNREKMIKDEAKVKIVEDQFEKDKRIKFANGKTNEARVMSSSVDSKPIEVTRTMEPEDAAIVQSDMQSKVGEIDPELQVKESPKSAEVLEAPPVQVKGPHDPELQVKESPESAEVLEAPPVQVDENQVDPELNETESPESSGVLEAPPVQVEGPHDPELQETESPESSGVLEAPPTQVDQNPLPDLTIKPMSAKNTIAIKSPKSEDDEKSKMSIPALVGGIVLGVLGLSVFTSYFVKQRRSRRPRPRFLNI
ncbi:hypothetical protein O9G_004526 [Rozella allomycis CSF55]|uniref:Uncharacterized protein n=1 Tax=Rozella allomycis (strain CSF55) TaxID=988480 RepID=A0A075AWP8_ROZAC|nr:hypothetical protein O9G_004526 [Rozella allomycis CSF55]|eukprot:EPZ34760.1 hypothetical protein O9G_004526 [Rozella allomycis CSF55]